MYNLFDRQWYGNHKFADTITRATKRNPHKFWTMIVRQNGVKAIHFD